MINVRLGYGCGLKVTLLTPAGSVCDLRKVVSISAVLRLPSGETMPADDISVDKVTNAVYVRLLENRELTKVGTYGIVFNVKLNDGVMYSTPMLDIVKVSETTEEGYQEITTTRYIVVTDLPENAERTGASPKISDHNTWLVYNDVTKAYEDSGVVVTANDFYTKAETDEKVTKLESKVGGNSQPTIIEFTKNCRFATGASPIDVNAIIQTTSWRCAKVECSEGERFAINGTGGGADASLYTFVDASGNILERNQTENPIAESLVVEAPKGAVYLLINDFNTGKKSYKGVPLENSLEELESELAELAPTAIKMFATLLISDNTTSILADANNAEDNSIYMFASSKIPANIPIQLGNGEILLTITSTYSVTGSKWKIQNILDRSFNVLYSRYYTAEWSEWKKSQEEFKMSENLVYSENYKGILADANNAEDNTSYLIEMSAIPANFPTDYTFASLGGKPIRLHTYAVNFNETKKKVQHIIKANGEVAYFRILSASGWSEWGKIQAEPTMTMYPTFVTTTNIASIVPNADNAADNTIYRIGSRTYPSNFPIHFPSAKAPSIYLETKVVGLTGVAMKYQTIYDENMRALWARDYNGDWGGWRSIQHFISVRKNGSGEEWSYKSLYEALQFAINNDHTFVEVYDGEYDIIEEMGDDLVDGHIGILLGHDMKIKFHPNAYVTAHYKGESNSIKSVFSAFMVGEGDFEIDGLNLSCSNIRYCIHDDNARAYSEYKHIYRNCKMLMDNSNNTAWDSRQCIGGGLGESAVIVIENCFFESVGSENNAEVSYHNCGYGTTARSEIHISNCYFKNSTCRFGYYGDTTNITSCYVSGCRAKQKPYIFRESNEYDKVNMELFEWNNEIVI